MSKARTAARNVGLLSGAGILARLAGLVVTALLARHLGEADFGTYRLCLGFAALFAVIARLGIRQVVVREVAGSPGLSSRYFGISLPMHVVQAALSLVVMMVVARILGYERYKLLGIFIMGLATSLLAFEGLFFAALEAWDRMGARAGFLLGRQVVWTLLALAGIYLGKRYIFFTVAQLITGLVIAAALAVYIHNRLFRYRPTLDLTLARKLYRDGLPLAGATILVDIYSRVDLVMIDQMRTAPEVGNYAAAANVVFAMLVINTAITTVVFPLFSRMKEEDPHRMEWATERAVKWVACALVPMSALLSAYAEPVIRLIYGAEYDLAVAAFRIIVWMLALRACAATMGRALVSLHLQARVFWVSLVSVLLNVGGNLLLIPRWGIMGASIASVCTLTLVVLLNMVFLHRNGLKTGLGSILLRVFFAGGLVFWFADVARIKLAWYAIPAAAVLYGALLFPLRLVDAEDRHYLKKILQR